MNPRDFLAGFATGAGAVTLFILVFKWTVYAVETERDWAVVGVLAIAVILLVIVLNWLRQANTKGNE